MEIFTRRVAKRLLFVLAQASVVAAIVGCGGGGGGGSSEGGIASAAVIAPTAPVTSGAPASPAQATVAPGPFAAWTAALSDFAEDGSAYGVPAPTQRTLSNQTVRQVARAAAAGTAIRLKFSNEFGKAPITFTRVRVARSAGGSAIEAGSDQAVTFGGSPSVTIPAGADAWTDAIALPVAVGTNVAVSVYVQGTAEFMTAERFSQGFQYVAAGDTASAGDMSTGTASATRYWLDEMDVYRTEPAKVVVAFGDSITQGLGAGSNRRYTDVLQARLTQAGAYPSTSVVNMGITGNRWLYDVPGPRGTQRFERDVLRVTGVTHAIVLLGINDIGAQALTGQRVNADDVIAALATAAASARQAGIQVLFGTLLPFKGHAVYSAQNEAMRQAVNAWIRTRPAGVAVVDFDAALRNPVDPAALAGAYDSGDHEHPSEAGYQRMAEAVDLATLR